MNTKPCRHGAHTGTSIGRQNSDTKSDCNADSNARCADGQANHTVSWGDTNLERGQTLRHPHRRFVRSLKSCKNKKRFFLCEVYTWNRAWWESEQTMKREGKSTKTAFSRLGWLVSHLLSADQLKFDETRFSRLRGFWTWTQQSKVIATQALLLSFLWTSV